MEASGEGSMEMLNIDAFVHTELKVIVSEATDALARLDADRLEDLALCCRNLNRALSESSTDESSYERSLALRAEIARQAREATGAMAQFSQVLSATRANLKVIAHIRTASPELLSYGDREAGWMWMETEN